MKSVLADVLKVKLQPVAVILTDEKPADGIHFKEGAMFGCVASMLVTAGKKGRTAYFDRKTFGCPGGGTGLGFGNRYTGFPIQCLLSTGDKEWALRMGMAGSEMEDGERFFQNPEVASRWVDSLPFKDVPFEYVVFKPLEELSAKEEPAVVVFFVNADQLSALVVMAGYARGVGENVCAPFGGACQSILFGYAEAEKDNPRGIIGFFDIAQRNLLDRETLTFTLPYKMLLDMEASIKGSFLEMPAWQKLRERQGS